MSELQDGLQGSIISHIFMKLLLFIYFQHIGQTEGQWKSTLYCSSGLRPFYGCFDMFFLP